MSNFGRVIEGALGVCVFFLTSVPSFNEFSILLIILASRSSSAGAPIPIYFLGALSRSRTLFSLIFASSSTNLHFLVEL
jgi:hypothetical protein